jgi:hypothetical protein
MIHLEHYPKILYKKLKNSKDCYKYSQYHENPDGIIKYILWSSINGDNKPLDKKLAQLNKMDAHQSPSRAIQSRDFH